ncbi:MAG: hypothetical protein R3C29_10160 [Dehalococcoidia bacterium]
MTNPGPQTAREAAELNAKAVAEGNLAVVMGQLTPEAMAQMMQLGAQGGGLTPQQMPAITGYTIEEAGSDGESETFNVTFTSAIGTATVAARWKQVLGQWKIAGIALVSAEQTGEAGS